MRTDVTAGRPAAAARGTLLTLLDAHVATIGEPALGVGPDPYHRTAAEQPMALALYADGLTKLAATTGSGRHLDAAISLAERLADAAPDRGRAWGLGFGWRLLGPEEAYAITTAICGRAFLSLHLATGSERHRRAAAGAADWLCEDLAWPEIPGTGHAAPAYSPGLPYALPNVASMVGGFLWTAAAVLDPRYADRAETATLAVVAAQREGCWTYGETDERQQGAVPPSAVVDLIHSSYTLVGLAECVARAPSLAPRRADCAAAARIALRAGLEFVTAQLATPAGWCREKVVFADTGTEQGAELANRPRLRRRQVADGVWIVAFPAESRLWGYGAWLTAVSSAADVGLADAELLLPVLDHVLGRLAVDPSARFPLTSSDRRAYPRHEAHLFEGLVAAHRAIAEAPA